MNLWIILAIGSAIGWAAIVLLDKFVIDSEIDNPMGTGGLHAFFNCLAVASIAMYMSGFALDVYMILSGLLLGGLYVLANYFWFSGVGSEEVSRFAPVLSFDVVFISILSFIFLQETFSPLVYGGISLTVVGCILISLEDPLKSLSKMKSRWALVAALSSAFAYSLREVIFKHVSAQANTWTILSYFGIAGMIFSTLLIYKSRNDIKGKTEGLELMTLSGLISGIAQTSFFLAVSLGPVSLVSTITKTRFFLIFLGATAISRLHPEIIHEPLERKILIQKLVATALIITGVLIAAL